MVPNPLKHTLLLADLSLLLLGAGSKSSPTSQSNLQVVCFQTWQGKQPPCYLDCRTDRKMLPKSHVVTSSSF